MTSPFQYPPTPHARRHGPVGYADYGEFRPWLRDEFSFRCVYCLQRERWGRLRAAYAIDHFEPVSLNPELELCYGNLLYCCSSCNSAKGKRILPNPLSFLLSDALSVGRDGIINATTDEARKIVLLLGLNSVQETEYRRRWIEVLELVEQHEPELYGHYMGFPDDLPDLGRLNPPGGNDRPEGIEESHYRRRQRGVLPKTY